MPVTPKNVRTRKKSAKPTPPKRKRPRVMVTVNPQRLAAMREKNLSVSEATDIGMAVLLAPDVSAPESD